MQADVETPEGIVTVAMQGRVITKGHEQVWFYSKPKPYYPSVDVGNH